MLCVLADSSIFNLTLRAGIYTYSTIPTSAIAEVPLTNDGHVTGVPWSEAVAQYNSSESTNVNFCDLLGTTGCLLNCEECKQLQSALSAQPGVGNAGVFKKNKEVRWSYKERNERHFALQELAASIQNSCHSCKTMHFILEHVSFRPEDQLYDPDLSFNVTAGFVLSRKPILPNKATVVRLFHPYGSVIASSFGLRLMYLTDS